MKLVLFFLPIFVSFSAQATIACKATLQKEGIAIKSDLNVSKIDGDITVLSATVQERSFIVSYNSSKHIYVLSVSDYKKNQRNVMTLANVNPEQESSGIVLSNAPINPDEEEGVSTILICTKPEN